MCGYINHKGVLVYIMAFVKRYLQYDGNIVVISHLPLIG